MSALTSGSYTLTREPAHGVETGAATEDTLATPTVAQSRRGLWQDVIDQKLVEWGRNPQHLAEEELIAPTSPAVQRATSIALSLRDSGAAPPMRAVPDGDGGIVLERWAGPLMESIEIDARGEAEYVVCRNERVTERHPVGQGL